MRNFSGVSGALFLWLAVTLSGEEADAVVLSRHDAKMKCPVLTLKEQVEMTESISFNVSLFFKDAAAPLCLMVWERLDKVAEWTTYSAVECQVDGAAWNLVSQSSGSQLAGLTVESVYVMLTPEQLTQMAQAKDVTVKIGAKAFKLDGGVLGKLKALDRARAAKMITPPVR